MIGTCWWYVWWYVLVFYPYTHLTSGCSYGRFEFLPLELIVSLQVGTLYLICRQARLSDFIRPVYADRQIPSEPGQ